MILNFFSDEKINDYKCSCGKTNEIMKNIKIENSSDLICVNVKRVQYENGRQIKNEENLQVSSSILIKKSFINFIVLL